MIENPIAEAAEKIRAITKDLLVNKLASLYPQNYHYMSGNYPVHMIKQGYGEHGGGFFRNADVIVLARSGEFIEGNVRQNVSSVHTTWEFREAKMKPAEDLAVVRFSPHLILSLFSLLKKELPDLDSPERIQRSLGVLSERGRIATEIISLSRRALVAMGEDDPDFLPEGDRDYGILAMTGLNEMFAELGYATVHPELLTYINTFDIYQRRGEFEAAITSICSNMRAQPVEEWFKELVDEVLRKKLFPGTGRNQNGINWHFTHHIRSSHPYDYHTEIPWYWGISESGEVSELRAYVSGYGEDRVIEIKKAQRCPEHLLSDGPKIARIFLENLVKSFYPKLTI